MAEKRRSGGDTLRKLLARLRPYGGWLAASLGLAALTVALTLWLPVLIGRAVDCILGPGAVDLAALGGLLGRMAAAIAGTAAAQWLMNVCNNRLTYGITRDLRAEAFGRIQVLPLAYLDTHPTGELVSRVIADIDQLGDGLLMGFTQLFSGVLTILGTIGFMLGISGRITLVVVLITPVSLFAASFIARRTYRMFRLQSETRGEQTALIDELVGGQKVVQAFGCEQRAQARFDEVNARLAECSLRATFSPPSPTPAPGLSTAWCTPGSGCSGPSWAWAGASRWASWPAFSATPTSTPSPSTRSAGSSPSCRTPWPARGGCLS